MSGLLDCVELGTAQASRSVIWLHGLGADGHDFEPIVEALDLPEPETIRFVFPHAPVRAVTINAGMRMRAWYDIRAARIEQAQDDTGIHASQRQLEQLIEREIRRGTAAAHIVLAGFSQGGAIALHTGLRYPQRLAGILALSTYLPLADSFDTERHPANQETPLLLAHGLHDPIVPYSLAEQTRALLQQAGYHIDWHSYPMQHQVIGEEIRDISRWLQNVLS